MGNFTTSILRWIEQSITKQTIMFRTHIIGSGSHIPTRTMKNADFASRVFYENYGKKLDKDGSEITEKFKEITTIAERRYADDDQLASDLGKMAAEKAIADAGIDREKLDYIIVGHNFGDISFANRRTELVPSLSAKIKHHLGIENPFCVAYDLPFGCPSWLQGVIQADYYLKSGDAKYALVIGAETLSRVCDPHDRDSMLYADGAGAVVLEARQNNDSGLICHVSRSDTKHHAFMLHMGPSYAHEEGADPELYLKMTGRKLYQYALEHVPHAMKMCLDKGGVHIDQVAKVLIHQANAKMDEAILQRLYALYDRVPDSENLMPMSISWLGNSSVATLPTLYDLISHNELGSHNFQPGDLLLFASVGAGMHINAFLYRVPLK